MTTSSFVGAKAAASVVVTVALGASVTAVAATQSLADTHARGRAPVAAHGADLPLEGRGAGRVRVPPLPAPTSSVPVEASAGEVASGAVTDGVSVPSAPEPKSGSRVLANRSAAGAHHGRGPASGVRQASSHVSVAGRRGREGAQSRAGKLSHRGGSAAGGAVSAVREAGEGAQHAAQQRSAAAGSHRQRHSGGGKGSRGKGAAGGSSGGRNRRASGTTLLVSNSGASASVAPAVAGAVAAVSLSAPVAATPPASLVPQILGTTAQPSSKAAGRLAAAQPRAGALASGLLSAPFAPVPAAAASAPAPAAEASAPHRVRTAAARKPVRAASNPLEGIGRHIPLPIPVPDWSKPIIIALALLALWFGVRSRVAALRARRLERQRAALLRDLGAMQAALVPEVPERLGGLAVSVAYRPAEGPAAGGDFYDLFMPQPGRVAIVLGDVAGHGHEALTHAALTRYTLRAYLEAGLEPRTALALAGRVLVDPTGERYATVAIGIYDEQTATFSYALAGHPPPMVVGADKHAPVTACSSTPIGWSTPTGRRQTTVSLPRGSEICFFSDGLVEARVDGQLLGRERLGGILAGLGSDATARELLERVREASQQAPDDMVACLLRPESAGGERLTQVEELEVDARMLARPGVRRFLRECDVPEGEATRALARAREIAVSSGAAVLRVELGREGGVVTADVPGPLRARRGTGVDARAERPMLEALAAG